MAKFLFAASKHSTLLMMVDRREKPANLLSCHFLHWRNFMSGSHDFIAVFACNNNLTWNFKTKRHEKWLHNFCVVVHAVEIKFEERCRARCQSIYAEVDCNYCSTIWTVVHVWVWRQSHISTKALSRNISVHPMHGGNKFLWRIQR